MMWAKKIILGSMLSLSISTMAHADMECYPEVQSVLADQKQAFIDAHKDMASQAFSKRPGSFAKTTCLDNLMKGNGIDIFFKPPNLDDMLNQVINLACEQASQIFNGIAGGSNIGGIKLDPGQLVQGLSSNGKSNVLQNFNLSGHNINVDLNKIKDAF